LAGRGSCSAEGGSSLVEHATASGERANKTFRSRLEPTPPSLADRGMACYMDGGGGTMSMLGGVNWTWIVVSGDGTEAGSLTYAGGGVSSVR
jgi:hypothetical protein